LTGDRSKAEKLGCKLAVRLLEEAK
jgi:hypothetical protein